MPHILNQQTVAVALEELIPQYWNCWNTLRSELSRYKDETHGIKRAQRACRNRAVLINFDTLPLHIQNDLGDPRKVNHILERYYKRDSQAVDFYSDHTTKDGNYILPEAQERYVINASLMMALTQLKADREQERINKGGSLRGILTTLATDAESFKEIMLAKFGYSHNVPTSKRFKIAFRDFRRDGYISLIKDRKGASIQNARKVNEEAIQLFNNMFASQRHKPTPTEIANQYNAFILGKLEVINTDTGEVYNPKDFKTISNGSIRSYLKKWENQIGNEAVRNGDRQKLMTKFDPYHSFTQPQLAGSIISVDDRQPPFEYEKGKRMWFYNGIDLASECITTWVYGKSKEGIILEFYRQMIRNYHEWGFNIPNELECESSLNSSYRGSFLKEGQMFQDVTVYANKARSKRIEAYYKPLRYQIEKKREGWIARPFSRSEANQISNVKRKLIPYQQLTDECLADIQTWNNMEHSKAEGMTRWEYFCANQNPDVKPTNYKAILPHLGEHTKSSCNAGITRFNSKKWLLGDHGKINTGEKLISLMKLVEGKTFDIYWLNGNDYKIIKALVYMDGRYICELLPKPVPNKARIEQTDADREGFTLMQRYEATVNGFMKVQKNSLEKVTIIDHRETTLNNKFKIPQLHKEALELPSPNSVVEPLPDFDDTYEINYNSNPADNL